MSDLLSYVINMPDFEELFEKLSKQSSNNISGIQKIKGKYLSIPPIEGDYQIEWVFDKDIYITDIKYSQSCWRSEDYWDLRIGDTLLFEDVYTKRTAENEIFNCYSFVPANTKIALILHNISGTSKDVWANLHYLSEKLIQEQPSEPIEDISDEGLENAI